MNRIKSTLTTWMEVVATAWRGGMGRTPFHNGARGRQTLDITTPPTASHELGGSARKFGQRSGTVHNIFNNTEKETP